MNKTDLERRPEVIGEADLPNIPPMMGAIGTLAGIRVLVSPALKYDEMYIAQQHQAIVVGELAHFRYRIEQLNLNKKCRKLAQQDIEDAAWRILGEHWKVSSS